MPYSTHLADISRARLRIKDDRILCAALTTIILVNITTTVAYWAISFFKSKQRLAAPKAGHTAYIEDEREAEASKTNDNKIKKKKGKSKEKAGSKERGSKEKEKAKRKSKEKIEQKEEMPVAVEEKPRTDRTQDEEEAKKDEDAIELPQDQTQEPSKEETEGSKKKQKFLIISMLGQKEELPEAGYAKDGEEVLAAFSKMQCEWDEKGGEASVAITNKTDTKLAMKIKSSDNTLFRVRPVYTNIEPGKSVDLGIYRSAGPVKNDRIVVILTKNTTDNPAEKVYEDKTIKTITTIIRQTGKEPKEQKVEEKPQEGKPSEKEQKVEEKPTAPKEEKSGAREQKQPIKPPGTPAKIGQEEVATLSAMHCEWDDKGGRQTITVTNTSNERLAMKIKCSDNTIFRIDPVFTNIEPGKSADVAIIRSAAPAKEDKLVLVLAKNPTNVAPETVYKDKSIPTSTMILPQKPIAR